MLEREQFGSEVLGRKVLGSEVLEREQFRSELLGSEVLRC